MPKRLTKHDLCRLCLQWSLSNRKIADLSGISPTTVAKYRSLLKLHGITRERLDLLEEREITYLLQARRGGPTKGFTEPDWALLCRESQRRGVTVLLLHWEYLESIPPGSEGQAMSLSTFRRRLDGELSRERVSMRQCHPPGSSMCVDFSGKHLFLTDPESGEKAAVEIFVAVLPHSRLTFAIAVQSQGLPNWIHAHITALEYFGGSTERTVPDNLRSAVTTPKRGSKAPIVNETYLDWAEHYGTFIDPARPRHPKDKSPVEIGVRIVNTCVIARLRNHVFHSLEEINAEIRPLVERINNKETRSLRQRSRRQLFEESERVALRKLPCQRYEYAERIHNIRVPLDYHVECRGDHYSVPNEFIGKTVTIKVSRCAVKIYGELASMPVATHRRGPGEGKVFTNPEHQTARHRLYAGQNVEELVQWAQDTHAEVAEFFRALLSNKRIPPISAIRQMSRAQRLLKEYGFERFVNACQIANKVGTQHVDNLANILKNQIDLRRKPVDEVEAEPLPHDNIRGPSAYRGDGE